ncbi:MAG: hypothetical protein ACJA00_000438, partial [Myxococcota bacterium]
LGHVHRIHDGLADRLYTVDLASRQEDPAHRIRLHQHRRRHIRWDVPPLQDLQLAPGGQWPGGAAHKPATVHVREDLGVR